MLGVVLIKKRRNGRNKRHAEVQQKIEDKCNVF